MSDASPAGPKKVADDLDTHEADTSNPHDVKASQITDHTKATHDDLDIDADTLDGDHGTDFLKNPSAPSARDALPTTNRSPSADRWTHVTLTASADSTATQPAEVTVNADIEDDGTEQPLGQSYARAGLGTPRRGTFGFLLPPGATYSVENTADPGGSNSATAYEIVL